MAAFSMQQQNMGSLDRLARGVIGSALLINGFQRNSAFGRWEALAGGLFLALGIIGIDPVLSRFGASTNPKAENNIFNLAKQALPGQGVHPMTTQQAAPARPLVRQSQAGTLVEALAIR